MSYSSAISLNHNNWGKRSIAEFRNIVWMHYRKNGRLSLPWRKTKDPYRILVSEMMLQQTQVHRVLPKYKTFLKRFPTLASLARSSLASVLREWQGLGYNRRAKYLHDAAKTIIHSHAGKFPPAYAELIKLPGIGTYTASAIRAFAWNEPETFIETNIRSAFIHHFFQGRENVRDAELIEVLTLALPKEKSREWHYALMDYGAHLKKTEGNASRQSAHHVKQKPFKGSEREVRGAILRALSKKTMTRAELQTLPFAAERLKKQSTRLVAEGLIAYRKDRYALPK